MMSSPLAHFFDFTIPNALHLAGILVLALICIRLLRAATSKIAKPASTQTKSAQQREQQARELADRIYSVGSQLIWLVAALTALPEFGISSLPAGEIAGAYIWGFCIRARETASDVIARVQQL